MNLLLNLKPSIKNDVWTRLCWNDGVWEHMSSQCNVGRHLSSDPFDNIDFFNINTERLINEHLQQYEFTKSIN